MATNTKLRTEDILEVLDGKIKASSDHTRLDVLAGDDYDSVLGKIAARSPTLDQKDALDGSQLPSGTNPFITVSHLNELLSGKIPWKTIGPVGSGADFSGDSEAVFNTAFSSGGSWFYIRSGTYTFSTPVTVPAGVKLVGTTPESTLLTSSGTTLILSENSYLGFVQVTGTLAASVAGDNVTLQNCVLSAPTTVLADGVANLKAFDVASLLGTFSATTLSDAMLSGLYFNTPALTPTLVLDTPSNVSVVGSIFMGGALQVTNGTNVRIVANHLGGGVVNTTPVGSVLLRANTPNSNNNDSDDFVNLLRYLGSPDLTEEHPDYASNYAGDQGQDLTARASGIDLLLQWRFEERNFHLVADNATTLSWNPVSNTLSSTGDLYLISAHRQAPWLLPQITPTEIPVNHLMYYYILGRSLAGSAISLTAQVAALGSLPNDITAPNTTDNRQIYVIAFNLAGTLWWRGGNGSRFPSTGGQAGVYFVDGSSKSFLTYLGAEDYNDSDPNYSDNFAGIQGEGLTTRLGKTDTLIRRLFEFSNLSYYLSTGGFISAESATLSLSGSLYFLLPHVTGRLVLTSDSWSLSDGQLVYLTWNQASLAGVDQTVTATISTTVPLPDAYPLSTKYFVLAVRKADDIILWNGSKISAFGGRWPLNNVQSQVIPTDTSAILNDNIVWTGTDLLWESLALTVSSGIPAGRNLLTDHTTASAGLTDLSEGEGLVLTFTCNEGTVPNYAGVQKVTLPVTLGQNQMLWARRLGGVVSF